jgi:hypothetical protein
VPQIPYRRAQRICAAKKRSVEVAAVVDLSGDKFGAATIQRCRKPSFEDLRLRGTIVGIAESLDDNAIDSKPPFFFETFGGGLVGCSRRHRRTAFLAFYLRRRDGHGRLGCRGSSQQEKNACERGNQDTASCDRGFAARKPPAWSGTHSGPGHGAGALISHGRLRISSTLSRLSWKLMLPVNRSWRSHRKNQ